MSTLIEEMDDNIELGGELAQPEKIEKPKEPQVEHNLGGDDEEPEAVEAVADESDEGDEVDDEPTPKKKSLTAKERINQLVQEKRELERKLEREQLKKELREELKLPADETMLRAGQNGGNIQADRVVPDPRDLDKYPLGALDDRYIEDRTEYLAEVKLEKLLSTALHRQQEQDARVQAEQAATELLKKADGVVQKGSELYDDFQETVWEAGKRGEYRLEEPTFLALTEAEHGAQIAYALATNKAEAARVASLSPFGQVQYVAQKNAEFGAKAQVRLPKAGTPPAHQSRGSSGKFTIPVDTDDLAAFSKLYFNDSD
jgi:hypothetical protein